MGGGEDVCLFDGRGRGWVGWMRDGIKGRRGV